MYIEMPVLPAQGFITISGALAVVKVSEYNPCTGRFYVTQGSSAFEFPAHLVDFSQEVAEYRLERQREEDKAETETQEVQGEEGQASAAPCPAYL